MSLNEKQIEALEAVDGGHNVFITGSAGVGKSHLVKSIQESIRVPFETIAPTGIAALNINGKTIHNLFALKIYTKTMQDYLKYCQKYSKMDWKRIKMFIVDEVSMWDVELFKLCDEICRFHKRKDIPFGGIQMVLVGDFFQLGPIESSTFIFETDLWTSLNLKSVILDQVMRQDDAIFIKHLNNIRVGNITEETESFIHSLGETIPETVYTKLYAKNVYKARANEMEMKKINSDSVFFTAIDTGDVKKLSSLLVEKVIQLKKGTNVMLLKNLDVDAGLCNGSTGTVIDFNSVGLPIVLFNGHTTPITIEKGVWEINERNSFGTFKIIASRKQIPLVISYAMSIHKSQGMSIDYVEADSTDVFANGQFYVMLSRAKTKKGLIVHNFDKKYVMVDEKVKEFYKKTF